MAIDRKADTGDRARRNFGKLADAHADARWVIGEHPAGSGTTYTLAHRPIDGVVALFKNGLRLDPSDYAVSGSTIETTASTNTAALVADYRFNKENS